MYKAVIWTAIVIGAAIGVFPVIMESVGLMVVMGIIGAAFGCAFGAGISLFLRVVKNRTDSSHVKQGDSFMEEMDSGPVSQLKFADKDQFPMAGDPDPVARAMTGSPDLANLNKNQGF